MMGLKIITPASALSYAKFLNQNEYYEESFKAYERAIELF